MDTKQGPVQFKPSHTTLKWLFSQPTSDVIGKSFTFKGRIARAKQIFVHMTDSSTTEQLQLVLSKPLSKTLANQGLLFPCTTIAVRGTLRKSQNEQKQKYDFDVSEFQVLGKVSDPVTFLPSLKGVSLDTWRKNCDTRFHAPEMQAIFRIRAALSWYTSLFMKQQEVLHLDPEPLTSADCEGAGEMFVVTTLMDSGLVGDLPIRSETCKPQTLMDYYTDLYQFITDSKTADPNQTEYLAVLNVLKERIQLLKTVKVDWKKDHFENDQPVRLTCSSQLGLEYMVPAMGAVYTSLPSFRAEKSNTKRHLASFTHIEAELPFVTFQDLMDFIESYVVFCIRSVLSDCATEIRVLDTFLTITASRADGKVTSSSGCKTPILDKLVGMIKEPFGRISYTEAISLLDKHSQHLKQLFPEVKQIPKWGEDLGGECERFLSEVIFKKPIFVFDMPQKLKSFYMKQKMIKCADSKEDRLVVEGCDLLVPSLGELVGASIRESDYLKLTLEMLRRGMVYHIPVLEGKSEGKTKSKFVTDETKQALLKKLESVTTDVQMDVLLAEFKIDFGPLQKYVGLRKNAATPTGGFGLGFERLVTICTTSLDGGNIRDRRPFYAAYKDCQF